MTVAELMRSPSQIAARRAERTYNRAIAEHFADAHRLLIAGKPDEAERVARGAALLRQLAYLEVRV